jgi:putative membrane protein
MGSVFQSFQEGFPTFLIWTGSAGLMLIAAVAVYVLLTPWKELALVKGGNGTAGLALAGAIVGLAIPLASCLASSVSLLDLVLWGIVSLILQLLAYRLTDLLLKDLPERIKNDEAGAAIVLIGTKLASAMLLAAGLWDPALQRF